MCRVCGCKIVSASVSMLHQLHYRRSCVRALNSRLRLPSQLRSLSSSRVRNLHFSLFFWSPLLASAASRNFTAPRLIGACFLLPFWQFVLAHVKSTILVASERIKGDVLAFAGLFRREVGRAAPSSLGAFTEGRQLEERLHSFLFVAVLPPLPVRYEGHGFVSGCRIWPH